MQEREKYAPGALAEQKNHEKDIPEKAREGKSMPEVLRPNARIATKMQK